ncbi:hypothetical protein ACIRFH_36590, partial [Streptomyces sp. NPDC093586]|uniref:hypothetical protein n=1 Tax=Streptomyces sp. NPDC093586 TaxID=3366042 RepID=UPI00382D3E6E
SPAHSPITTPKSLALPLTRQGQNPKIFMSLLGRVLKVVHDGVDRVPIGRSLVVDPVLKHALRHLRFVKSQQPPDADSVEFADWRERIAEALDALACVLVFKEDRARARAEAAAALEQAAAVRRRRKTGASEC